MPRKEWIPRNPYSRKSRLDEDEFEGIMSSYFYEVLDNQSKNRFQEYVRNTDWQLWERGSISSRQAINKYYEKISQYTWDNFIVKSNPLYQEDGILDELIDLIYGKIDKISIHEDLYHSFNDFPFYTDKDEIIRSLMFYLLSNRSKKIRGFKRDKFYLEFSRVYFICAVVSSAEIELRSIYSINDPEKAGSIVWACQGVLRAFLKAHPL